jgi:hypothetical protein
LFTSGKADTEMKWSELSPSGAPINGLAWVGEEHLAISTRIEVSFWGTSNGSRAVFPFGAHDVISTNSGHFIAPLGPAGLMVVQPNGEGLQKIVKSQGIGDPLYFSRVAVVRDRSGNENLICANRRDGFGVSRFEGGEGRRHVQTTRFEGVDVVDVCPVAPDLQSAIAISIRGEVFWIRDVFQNDDPVAMKLNGIEGAVYRVLATRRHLFVLTSKRFYVWDNLVKDVLLNGRSARPTDPFQLDVKAASMSLINQSRVMLVLGANEVLSFKADDFDETGVVGTQTESRGVPIIERSTGVEFVNLSPSWQRSPKEMNMVMAAAA